MPLKIEGPHELAWSMILDLIYGDAYQHGIGHIKPALGFEGLEKGIILRDELLRSDTSSWASAWLCREGISDPGERLYTVEMRNSAVPDARIWKLVKTYYVFTAKARLLGILIRLSQWFKQPQWEDAAMYQMRKKFISEKPTTAFYQLKIWTRKGEHL